MMLLCLIGLFIVQTTCFTVDKTVSLLNCNNLLIPKRINKKLSMSIDESLSKLQDNLQNTLSSSLGLKLTDFTFPYDVKYTETVNSNEVTGISKWFDETKGSKLTGVSSYYISTINKSIVSVSGWVGPISPVPHFILSIESLDSKLYRLVLDYIPRGSFPLGSDLTYFNQYFNNNELNSKYNSIYSTPNTFIDNKPDLNLYKRLLKSPNYIDISGLSYEDIEKYANEHINQWIKWLTEATQVDTRQRAGYNTRDDKLRQFYFQSNFYEALKVFNNDKVLSQKIAVSWSGPLAEAYVGGSS